MNISYFKPIYLFKDLSDDELQKIAKFAEEKTYMPGEDVFTNGQSATAFYVVIMGSVKITVGTSSGDEIQIRTLGSGSHFGEMPFLDGDKRSATVQAIEKSTLAEISYEKFNQILNTDSVLALKVYRSIAKFLAVRLRSTTQDLNQMKELKFHH